MAEQTEQPNERWQLITEKAKNYDKLKIDQKIQLLQIIQKDIQAERDEIEKTLSRIDDLFGSAPKPSKTAKTTTRKRTRKTDGGLSVKDAVAKVVEDGKEYKIAALTTAAEKVYGSEIKKASMNNALQVLKKEKVIKPTDRGVYKKA